MKLRGEPRRQFRLNSTEALQQTEHAQPFDLLKLVPSEVWRTEQVIQYALKTSSGIQGLKNLAELAEFNPKVIQKLRERPEAVAVVERLIRVSWPDALGYNAVPNEYSLASAAALLRVLPELRAELPKPTENQFESMLAHALAPHSGFGRFEFEFKDGHAQTLIRLLQLFPDRQPQIRSALDQADFKQKFDQAFEVACRQAETREKYLFMAQAAILYPERFSQYKAQASEYWPEIQKRISGFDNASQLATRLIWAAAVLNASDAKIDSNGKLDLGYSERTFQTHPLPERLVA